MRKLRQVGAGKGPELTALRRVRHLRPLPMPCPAQAAQAGLKPGFWSVPCHPWLTFTA